MFKLTIELGGDTFEPDARPELHRLLAQAARQVLNAPIDGGTGNLIDATGVVVGQWHFEYGE